MNFNEIREECKRRGFLDLDGNHIQKKTKEDIERRERLNRFMRQNDITVDDVMAFTDLAEVDDSFRTKLAEMIEKA